MAITAAVNFPIIKPIQQAITKFHPGSGGGSGGDLLFSDTFTDTNGTLLTAHTPDVDVVGLGWEVFTGVYDIQTNQAHSTGSSIAAADTNESDVIVEVTVTTNSSQGPAARASDASNFWIGWMNDGKLYEVTGGSIFARADLGAPSALPNTASLECAGSSITFSAETGLSVTYAGATTNQTVTKHGIRADNTGRYCDNFSVNSL